MKFIEELDLPFIDSMLVDPQQEVIKKYNLHFEVNQKIQDIYTNNFNLNLPNLTANETWELPVPATFVIGSDKIIKNAFIDMNYRERMTIEQIIETLKKIQT